MGQLFIVSLKGCCIGVQVKAGVRTCCTHATSDNIPCETRRLLRLFDETPHDLDIN